MNAVIEGEIILEGFEKIQTLKKLIDKLGTNITNDFDVETLKFHDYNRFFNDDWTEVESLREMPNLSIIITLSDENFVEKFQGRLGYQMRNSRCFCKRTDTTSQFWIIQNDVKVIYTAIVPTQMLYKIGEILVYTEELKDLEGDYNSRVHKMRYPEQYLEPNSTGVEKMKKRKKPTDLGWIFVAIWLGIIGYILLLIGGGTVFG